MRSKAKLNICKESSKKHLETQKDFNSCDKVIIFLCSFRNCSSKTSGGSISIEGGLEFFVDRSDFVGCQSRTFGGAVFTMTSGACVNNSIFIECSAADSFDDSGHAVYFSCQSDTQSAISYRNLVFNCPINKIGGDSAIYFINSAASLLCTNFTHVIANAREVFQSNAKEIIFRLNSFENSTGGYFITFTAAASIDSCIFIMISALGGLIFDLFVGENSKDSVYFGNKHTQLGTSVASGCVFCQNGFIPPQKTENCELLVDSIGELAICGNIWSHCFSQMSEKSKFPFLVYFLLK